MTAGDVHVVDGFYDDPDRIRDLALAAPFRDFGGTANFPGRESVKAYYSPDHAAKLARIVGNPIQYDPKSWVFGKFRLALRGESGRTSVHTDGVDWTAVVYLSRGDEATGGLGFYRHRRTGCARVPEGEQLAAFGCATASEFDERFVLPDSNDTAKWEKFDQVDIAYNRCVIFRGARLFHAITDVFGHQPDTGRLTQNFFFMDAQEG